MLFETKFLISLFITSIIEIPIIIIFVKFIFKNHKIPIRKIIIIGFIASAITLPYLWFILPAFVNLSNYIIVGESLVVIIESLIYYGLLNIKINESFIISLVANLISYAVGFIIFR